MADRSVRVVLTAITAPFTAGMAKAGAAAKGLEIQMGRTSAMGKATQGAFMGIGKGAGLAMAGAGLATYGLVKGLASVTGAAMRFESSFAGIRKTVDASEAEFQDLEEGMRRLATEIPVSVNELNRIGELGGQLGIAKENLVDFTAVVAKMGVTTNLTVEDAAMRFAQFANITQMPQSQFENLASSVVDLGNNFATTEADIVEFGQRIAGAGEIAGFSEGEILGIGTAVASLGVNAEAGGTAVQKVMLKITESVELGDDKLEKFAESSGMSADEFAKKWRQDPAQAFVAFTEGLGSAGTGAIGILKELGLTDQRLTRAFLALGSSGDLLNDTILTGNAAFKDANALQEEAAKRFETTEMKVQLAKQQIEEMKIAAGEGLALSLGDAAQAFTDVMQVSGRVNDSLESSTKLMTAWAENVQNGSMSMQDFQAKSAGLIGSDAELLGRNPEESIRFFKNLASALEDGTPIADEFGDALEETGGNAKSAGKDAEVAVRGFAKLFESGKDFSEWKDSVASGLSDLSGAFGELADDATLTAEDMIEAQRKQIEATRDFRENLNVLIRRGAKPEFIADLIEMGDEGALWAQSLADDNKDATKAFIKGRSDIDRELNKLENSVRDADRNVGRSMDGIGRSVKDNTSDWRDWRTASVKDIGEVGDELRDLWELVKKGVTAPGTVRAEMEGAGGPTVAGQFGSALAMGNQLMGQFPGLVRTSAYRPGDPGFHGDKSNPAGDYAMSGWPSDTSGVYSPQAGAISMAAISMFGSGIRELIYGNMIYENGRMGYYGANDHWGHIHMADMGAIVKGPAMIAQGNITEAHIPLSGPGAGNITLSGTLHIPGIGSAILEGARLEMRRAGHRGDRVSRVRANR